MPNSVQHSGTAVDNALKVGNLYMGAPASGPTSVSGFYTGINPPSGGYTVYMNKGEGGPSIVCPANDAALIAFTQNLTGESMADVNACFAYFAGETDKMVMHNPISEMHLADLQLYLIAGVIPSYPRSGTSWKDLSGNARNGTLTNSPTFNSNGYMDLDGVDDFISIDTYTFGNGNWTVSMVVNADNITVSNLLSNTSGGPVTNAFGFASSKIHYRNYDGAWQTHNGNTTLSTSKWYSLTWVNYAGDQASTGTMKMYVNGVADSSEFNSYATNGGPCNAIGSNWFSKFNGRIASTKFYTKSLTDAEILTNYYQGSNVTSNLVFAADAGNLVSYENGETTTYSLIGSLDGTLTNGVDFVNSNGGVWDFDGVDDKITLPNDLGYSATSVSVFAWYKINGTPGNSYHIICGDVNLEMSIHSSATYLRNGIGTTNGRFVSNDGNQTLNDGNYHYYGFTFDGSTKRAYIDGVAVGTQSVTGTLTTSFSARKLGAFSGGYQANGNIASYLVWNKVLTTSEIQQNYNANINRFN